MASDDEEIPETGAIFTFGKTRFSENLANKFWIRDDKVLQIACGDEHSAVVTSSGRLYTFGSNDWGQLGHGNTKPYSKPSVVKKLKGDRVKFVACGRSHSLVISESGVFSFGAGADSQLGHGDNKSYNIPTEIEALNEKFITQVACGAEHSAALTDNGELYMWGSGSEGQLGLGISECEFPRLLKFWFKVAFVSCGYYHTAVITENRKVYTFGDNEAGKLGLADDQQGNTEEPQHVKTLNEPAVAVACGGNHTAVVTKHGSLFTFGSGMHGQLGHGTSFQDVARPKLVSSLQGVVVSAVSCGENHTAVLTKNGEMFTFGDGRHGKLAMGDDSFSNLFKPSKVERFKIFHVEQVSCGGCHMLVAAVRKHKDVQDNERSEEDESNDAPRLSQTVPTLGMSARDKRRQKDMEGFALASSLPPLNCSLPPLNSLGLHSDPKNEETRSDSARLNSLNRSAMPIISIRSPSADEDLGRDNVNLRRLPPRPKHRQKQAAVSDSEEEHDRRQKRNNRPTPPPRKSRTAKENLQNNEDKIEPSGEKQNGSEASDEESDDYDKHSPSVSHHVDGAMEKRDPNDDEMSGEDESEEDGEKTERQEKGENRTMKEVRRNNQEGTEEDDSEDKDEDEEQRDGEKERKQKDMKNRTMKEKDNNEEDEIDKEKYEEDAGKKAGNPKGRKQKDVKKKTVKETRHNEESETEEDDEENEDGNGEKMNEAEQSEEDEAEEDESEEGEGQKDGKQEDKEKTDMKCRNLKEMENNYEEGESGKKREDDDKDSKETGRKDDEKVEDKNDSDAWKKDKKNKIKGKTKVDKENEEDGMMKDRKEQLQNEGQEGGKEENVTEVIRTKTKRSGICRIL